MDYNANHSAYKQQFVVYNASLGNTWRNSKYGKDNMNWEVEEFKETLLKCRLYPTSRNQTVGVLLGIAFLAPIVLHHFLVKAMVTVQIFAHGLI